MIDTVLSALRQEPVSKSARLGGVMRRAPGSLRGVRVLVAGAGLAGLTAARTLSRHGADVLVVEARTRLGGRVWTFRDAPMAPFCVEMGGEFIDGDHHALRGLTREFDLPLVRVLRRGFGLATSLGGRVRAYGSQRAAWERLAATLAPAVDAFTAADLSWDSTAAAAIAPVSLKRILQAAGAPAHLHAVAVALRGLLLADPQELSALVPVELLASGVANPAATTMYRIRGGNDRLIDALARDAKCRIERRAVVRAVVQEGSAVRVAVEEVSGRVSSVIVDYVVAAVPASTLRSWRFTPALPDRQQHAIRSLHYGSATKVHLRYRRRWWRRAHRPRAYGTDLPVGAVWESAEDQRGAAVLALLAGGGASAATRRLLERGGATAVSQALRWMNRSTPGPAEAVWTTWELDPWAGGGYAVFTTDFDPAARALLARGHGRVVFAGAHTSTEFQGYMNGAVETGLRAAAEIAFLHRLRPLLD